MEPRGAGATVTVQDAPREPRHLDALLRAMQDAVVLCSPERRIVDVNPALERLFGYSRAELLGQPTRILHVDDDRSGAFGERLAEALAAREPVRFDWPLRRRNGARFPADVALTPVFEEGTLVSILGIVRDLTPERQAEARFRALAEAVPQIVWSATPEGGNDYVSPRGVELTGVPVERWAAGGFFDLVHPEERQTLQEAWTRAMAMGDAVEHLHRVRMRDGTYRWHLSRAAPLRNAEGRVVRWFGASTDIHAQKMAEEDLARLRAELGQSEKMAALGSLVSGVAHELRTPLTFLASNAFLARGKLERLARQGATAEDALAQTRPFFDEMTAGVDRINLLVEDLRRYTKARSRTQRTPERLDAVVAEAVRLFRATHRSSNAVELDAAPTAPAPFDKGAVQQVVLNLVENAVDASPPGAPVRVRVREGPEGPEVEVRDQGCGMPPDLLAKMYEPLFSTKERGMGLGLTIVKRIVEEHRGVIACVSEPDRGTTFRVRLPRDPLQA